jgi:hypothetical protein
MILKGHPYHKKTDAELLFIVKDAGEAARAMQGHDSKAESKYLDQAADASTVLNYRDSIRPNAKQVAALSAYAADKGRTWKAALNADWLAGRCQGPLQQVRNNLGPSWLARFKLESVNG